jgi:NAD-dependent DNA ligase
MMRLASGERAAKNLARTSPVDAHARSLIVSLTGKRIVLTGKLTHPRRDVTGQLEAHGADVTSSVSAKTELIVAGLDAGSSTSSTTSSTGRSALVPERARRADDDRVPPVLVGSQGG